MRFTGEETGSECVDDTIRWILDGSTQRTSCMRRLEEKRECKGHVVGKGQKGYPLHGS